MVWLYILGGLLLLVALLLLSKLHITLKYNGGFSAELRYLFLKFDLADRFKPGEAEEEEEETEVSVKRKPADEAELSVKQLISLIKKPLQRLLHILKNELILEKLDLKLCVSTPDVDKTALLYGAASAALAVLTRLALSMRHSKAADRRIRVVCECDFIAEKSDFYADVRVAARVISVLRALMTGYGGFRDIQNAKKPVKE